ncbi:MAG: hypothetical protein WC867_06015 [Candidatus Pacearchaeota archaeon]|jgi:hypothetical protein
MARKVSFLARRPIKKRVSFVARGRRVSFVARVPAKRRRRVSFRTK